MSSDLDDRDPPYGDVAPESTNVDATLLYEVQEVTDPSGDVPKGLQESRVGEEFSHRQQR